MKAREKKTYVANVMLLCCFAILGAAMGLLIVLILTIEDPWFPKGWLAPVMLTLLFLSIALGVMIPLLFSYRNKVMTTAMMKGGHEDEPTENA